MTSFYHNSARAGFCLVALLACGATPASAAWIGYKNDTGVAVVVQGSSTGKQRPAAPRPTAPNERQGDYLGSGAGRHEDDYDY